jgi:Restriction endonuclease
MTLSETPKWKQFEDLVAEIQRELMPEAKVQTNLRRQGRRSQSLRQIDILVEMKAGQFDMSVVIDCKDYKKPADIKDVEAFIAMIEDLGPTKGAIISASGFTEGAIQRARDAGIDTYSLIATGDHPWAKLLSIPALAGDLSLTNYSFTLEMHGFGGGLRMQDWRYLKLYQSDGQLIDCALNLFIDRWSRRLIETRQGTHTRQPISNVETWVRSTNGQLYRLNVFANYTVQEELRLGRIPLKDMRGFINHQSGVVTTRGFTTEVLDMETLTKDWVVVASVDNLAGKPILMMGRQICPMRVELPPD